MVFKRLFCIQSNAKDTKLQRIILNQNFSKLSLKMQIKSNQQYFLFINDPNNSLMIKKYLHFWSHIFCLKKPEEEIFLLFLFVQRFMPAV